MSRLKVSGKVYLYETPHLIPVDPSILRKIAEGSNVVTDRGLAAMAALLGGGQGSPVIGGVTYSPGTVNGLYVTAIKLSTASSPAAAAATDTAMSGAIAATLAVTVSYPTVKSIKFSAVLPGPSLSGLTITEEGLFTADGKLVAHLTTSPFPYNKTTVGIQIDHVITLALDTDHDGH